MSKAREHNQGVEWSREDRLELIRQWIGDHDDVLAQDDPSFLTHLVYDPVTEEWVENTPQEFGNITMKKVGITELATAVVLGVEAVMDHPLEPGELDEMKFHYAVANEVCEILGYEHEDLVRNLEEDRFAEEEEEEEEEDDLGTMPLSHLCRKAGVDPVSAQSITDRLVLLRQLLIEKIRQKDIEERLRYFEQVDAEWKKRKMEMDAVQKQRDANTHGALQVALGTHPGQEDLRRKSGGKSVGDWLEALRWPLPVEDEDL